MLRLTSGLFCTLAVSIFAFGSEGTIKSEPPIRIECYGKLRSGVMAIGAETTGTTINVEGTTWELALKNDAAKTFAETHDKKPVSVSGSLRRVAGVEVPARWIVDVEKLSEWDARTNKTSASVTVAGRLRTDVSSKGGTTKPVLEANGIQWQLDFAADTALKTKAESLAQTPIMVTGTIERVPVNARHQNLIIHVSKLDASSDSIEK